MADTIGMKDFGRGHESDEKNQKRKEVTKAC